MLGMSLGAAPTGALGAAPASPLLLPTRPCAPAKARLVVSAR